MTRSAVSHQEQVPRKQGLKQETSDLPPLGKASRASSTKTRIETPILALDELPGNASRASSTKTRIETRARHARRSCFSHQEQVPRKQGLKPFGKLFLISRPGSSRASSTKTRIETLWEGRCWRAQIPSRASSTKTRIETCAAPGYHPAPRRIKSKFHENKD